MKAGAKVFARWGLQQRREHDRARKDGGGFMHAGPEIGVAAHEVFYVATSLLTLIVCSSADAKSFHLEGSRIIEALEACPGKSRLS